MRLRVSAVPTDICGSFTLSSAILCTLHMRQRNAASDVRVQLLALLHDSAESYIGDMTRPAAGGTSPSSPK